ncbi:metallophosphoesterase family protein [Kineococcus aurantiacus]|uniref:Putative phosphodiesterase n=1 Tax=Kineococcus aurantiacus TaxID=37633 RepID=A0A7Y9ATX8_9ACTN|nr:metallophosphoesterase [Kineococcus aurantiacus]NYD21709.1 putative phosphodiesterase [Kineococcus aurantiacus]
MSDRKRRPEPRPPRVPHRWRARWDASADRRGGRFLRRHLLPWLAVLVVGGLGAAAGFALAPGSTTYVGPLQTEVRVRPSLDPGVQVDLPPVGEVRFDTHRAPVLVSASIRSVDLDAAARLVRSPQQLLALELTAADTVRAAAVRAAAYSLGCGFAGALLAASVVFRGRRRTLQTGAALLVVVVATGGGAYATFDPAALRQPRFTGLLSRAPYLVSSTQNALERLESYRSGLSDIVRSVSTLYAAAANLPVLGDARAGTSGLGEDVTTVLHISDLHLNPLGYDLTANLVKQFGVQAVVDTGDTTTWGTAVESSFLARIRDLGVPYVWVRGNHDSTDTQAQVAAEGATVLDAGATTEVAGLVLAGQGDPVFTPDGEGKVATGTAEQVQEQANDVLADGIAAWDRAHPDRTVDAALVHDPSGLQPLLGRVPLVLAGHLHKRSVTLDASGTRVMVEGTTGGAGITAAGLTRLADGDPLPLSATLLYFGRSGDDAGRLLAYDEVTVGGLGLAEVNLQRTVLTDEDRPPLVVPSGSPTSGATGSATGSVTGSATGTATGG